MLNEAVDGRVGRGMGVTVQTLSLICSRGAVRGDNSGEICVPTGAEFVRVGKLDDDAAGV